MRPVKAINSQDPQFIDAVTKFDMLLELHADQRKIKVGEKFIRYLGGFWEVCKMSQERQPRLCGRFTSLHKAVWRSKLRM
jgi:hypothetical protein